MSKETDKKSTEPVGNIIISAPKWEEIRLRAVGMKPLLVNNGKNLARTIGESRPTVNDAENATVRSKTKKGKLVDPQADYEKSRYRIDDKSDGIPAYFFKKAVIYAANTIVPGVAKTQIKGAFFVEAEFKSNDPTDNAAWLLRLDTPVFPPIMDTRSERVGGKGPGTGAPDPRYRAIYPEWSCSFTVRYLSNLITLPNLLHLLNYAGECGGIAEHRPEKSGDGELGRFHVIKEEDYRA